jgi:Lrp/AsnC family leucine-responsive transcriptional regulator
VDATDLRLLRSLERDARQSYAALGRELNLSKTPAWQRVRQLEADGVIRGYRALLDPQKLGLQIHAFVQATILASKFSEFESAVQRHGSILECFTTAGQGDYMLHVLAADIGALDDLLRRDISRMPGVQRIVTTVCLKTTKERAPFTGCL